MERTISASELKNTLGAVLRVVRNEEESVVIEQRGVPAAAIVSIEDFRLLRETKDKKRRDDLMEQYKAFSARLGERQQDMSREEADQLVQELSDTVMDGVIEHLRARTRQSS